MASRISPGPNEGAAETRPAAGPAIELAALGAGLTLTVATLSRLPDWPHHLAAFQTLYVVAFGFFALAAVRLGRYLMAPGAALLVAAVALATRAALLPVPPSLSDDVYRYAWEGRVLAHGQDPWRLSPSHPSLAPLRDSRVWPRVNHPDLATIYPPAAEAGFALVAAVSSSIWAMKLWIAVHDLALVGVLMAWCARRAGGAAAALVYAWNPLVLIEYSGSAHHDPTALLPLGLAFLLAEERPALSGLALAWSALVKLAPLAALPFLMRRWTARGRIACVALLTPGLALYWALTRGSDSGLGAYWETWRNNALLFDALERVTGRYATARALALASIAIVAFAAWRAAWTPERSARNTLRAATLLSPVLHPWYLGWTLLFEPLSPSAPWLLLSLTVVLNYGVFSAPSDRAGFHLPLAWRLIEYGAPLALAIALLASRRAGRARARGGFGAG
ncbi:MAG: hypothetical protein HYR73_00345 [Candidatus Eisenbacteria bacterium]|nr:hypothetical protein [Candidatus Eisenbacteria bacterium]